MDMMLGILAVLVILGIVYVLYWNPQQQNQQSKNEIARFANMALGTNEIGGESVSGMVSGRSILNDDRGNFKTGEKYYYDPYYFMDPMYWFGGWFGGGSHGYRNRKWETDSWQGSPGYLANGKPITSNEIIQGRILMNPSAK
jgi:hypothetical protein